MTRTLPFLLVLLASVAGSFAQLNPVIKNWYTTNWWTYGTNGLTRTNGITYRGYERLTPQMFGADTGDSDLDTTAFLDCIRTANTNKIPVYVPAGTYVVGPLKFTNLVDVSITLDPSAVIKATTGYGATECIFWSELGTNVTITGGTFDMDRQYTTGGSRHCISIRGGAYNTVQNVTARYAAGDGFYISDDSIATGAAAYRTKILNCTAIGCRRQGISATDGLDTVVSGFRGIDIGRDATVGATDPSAGIDFEPNGDPSSLQLSDSYFSGCQFGVLLYGKFCSTNQPMNLSVSGVTVDNCDVGIAIGRFPDRFGTNAVTININNVTVSGSTSNYYAQSRGAWPVYVYDVGRGNIIRLDGISVTSSNSLTDAIYFLRDTAQEGAMPLTGSPDLVANVSLSGQFNTLYKNAYNTSTNPYAQYCTWNINNSQATGAYTLVDMGEMHQAKITLSDPVILNVTGNATINAGTAKNGTRIYRAISTGQTFTLDDSSFTNGMTVRIRNDASGELTITTDEGRSFYPYNWGSLKLFGQGAEVIIEKWTNAHWYIRSEIGSVYSGRRSGIDAGRVVPIQFVMQETPVGSFGTNGHFYGSNRVYSYNIPLVNSYVAAGLNVTVTTNTTETNRVYTIASSGGASEACAITNLTAIGLYTNGISILKPLTNANFAWVLDAQPGGIWPENTDADFDLDEVSDDNASVYDVERGPVAYIPSGHNGGYMRTSATNQPNFAALDFRLSFWLKIEELQDAVRVAMSKKVSYDDSYPGYMLIVSNDNRAHFKIEDVNGAKVEIVSPEALTTNVWYNLDMRGVVNGSDLDVSFYINEVLQGSGTITNNASVDNAEKFYLGGDGLTPDTYVGGWYDLAQIWTSAVTCSKVYELLSLKAGSGVILSNDGSSITIISTATGGGGSGITSINSDTNAAQTITSSGDGLTVNTAAAVTTISLDQTLQDLSGTGALTNAGAVQPAHVVLTNISATGANTNNYIAGTGISLTTNAGTVTIANTSAGTNSFVSLFYQTNFTFNIATQSVYSRITNYFGSVAERFGVNTATGHATNTDAGWYIIHITTSFSGTGGGGDIFEMALFTNNVECPKIEWIRKTSSTDTGSAAGHGLLYLPASTYSDIRIQNTGGTGNIGIAKHAFSMVAIATGTISGSGDVTTAQLNNASNVVWTAQASKQNGSAILTNLAGTGAITNIAAGSNVSFATNSGVIEISSTGGAATTNFNTASFNTFTLSNSATVLGPVYSSVSKSNYIDSELIPMFRAKQLAAAVADKVWYVSSNYSATLTNYVLQSSWPAWNPASHTIGFSGSTPDAVINTKAFVVTNEITQGYLKAGKYSALVPVNPAVNTNVYFQVCLLSNGLTFRTVADSDPRYIDTSSYKYDQTFSVDLPTNFPVFAGENLAYRFWCYHSPAAGAETITVDVSGQHYQRSFFTSPALDTPGLVAGWRTGFETNSGGVVTVVQTNRSTTIATNAGTVAVDFTTGTPWYRANGYLESALIINPTNLVIGREIYIMLLATNGNYNVTVTNFPGHAIRWNLNSATNGATSFTVTNNQRVELSLLAIETNVISAVYGHTR